MTTTTPPVRNIHRVDKWSRYRVNKVTGCWIWLAAPGANGYARLDGTSAHRVYYEKFVGAIPEGYEVDHLCERRNCVNPEHLEAVTKSENNRRRAHIQYSGKNAGECRRGHPMTGENVQYHGKKRKVSVCRQCARDRVRTGARKPYATDDVPVMEELDVPVASLYGEAVA